MKQRRTYLPMTVAAAALLVLILDANTAFTAAAAGVDLCIRTLIPALFPFFVLSVYLTGMVTGLRIPFLKPLGKCLRIPTGGESIFLVGLLGGYPVGAQCIGQAYSKGQLSSSAALHMLTFCNNAGPAFIFGMVGSLFTRSGVPVILWCIHILSAICVGLILPNAFETNPVISKPQPVSLSQAMQASLRNIATVCGWVVLFRMILSFLQRWILWIFPETVQLCFSGFLELANGCVALSHLPGEQIRFLVASIFLGFGGLCVLMQTASVLAHYGLPVGSYALGKLLHGVFSGLLAWMLAPCVFPDEPAPIPRCVLIPVFFFIIVIVLCFLKFRKITVAFRQLLVYNKST